jgi:hypothetical protein
MLLSSPRSHNHQAIFFRADVTQCPRPFVILDRIVFAMQPVL